MYGYVYITENLVNHKRYIGQHRAENFDGSYLGSGKYLWNAIRKYGKENFVSKILEPCGSNDELNEREMYWISLYDAIKSEGFYNITKGGRNCNPYDGLSAADLTEIGKKISMSHSGRIIVNNGKKEYHVKKETLNEYLKMGYSEGQLVSHKNKGEKNGMYNNTHSDEVKYRLSRINTGKGNPAFGKKWYNNGSKSIRCYPNDERIKGNEYKGGLIMREETRLNISKSMTGSIFVNQGGKSIRIPESELNKYLEKGFSKGSVNNAHKIGKICVTKDGTTRKICKEQVDSFLNEGWILGIAKRNKYLGSCEGL